VIDRFHYRKEVRTTQRDVSSQRTRILKIFNSEQIIVFVDMFKRGLDPV
jgi:hypothetical protein